MSAENHWRAHAACRNTDPALFFPTAEETEERAHAKRLCADCPVCQQCLDFAFVTHQGHGIWGGLTERERRTRRKLLRAQGLLP